MGAAYRAICVWVHSHPDALRCVLMVHPGEHGLEEAPRGGGGDQSERAPLTEQPLEVPAACDRGPASSPSAADTATPATT